MKVKIRKEELYRWYHKLTGQGMGLYLPDFITLEATLLQDNGTVEKCCRDYFLNGVRTHRIDCHRKEEKIQIVPSPRIDWCGDCQAEHGYDCPKYVKDIEELGDIADDLPNNYGVVELKAKINELVKGFNALKVRNNAS